MRSIQNYVRHHIDHKRMVRSLNEITTQERVYLPVAQILRVLAPKQIKIKGDQYEDIHRKESRI